MRRYQATFVVLTLVLAGFLPESAHALPRDGKNCYIFVHGKQTTNQSYYDWNVAWDYWRSSSYGTIGMIMATPYDRRSYYVVNYDGTMLWDARAAGVVVSQIVNATNGGADNGGHRCTYSYAQGGRFVVIAHSMGAVIMDNILGNAVPGTPCYNCAGMPLSTIGERISYVISLSGAHRGSELADATCRGAGFCGYLAGFVATCDVATTWLQTDELHNVKNYAAEPAKNIWLIGGYRGLATSGCLSGDDDGAVQYASQFACNGSATTAYSKAYPCGNSSKQESSGFLNFDAAYEDHFGCKDCSQSSQRLAITDGGWYCWGGSGWTKCAPGTILYNSYATCSMLENWVDTLPLE